MISKIRNLTLIYKIKLITIQIIINHKKTKIGMLMYNSIEILNNKINCIYVYYSDLFFSKHDKIRKSRKFYVK